MPAIDRLNLRFQIAKTDSNNPQDFGVIIHSLDGQEDPTRPWAVCPAEDLSCGFLSDRMSASVVYKGKTASYSGGTGVILRPRFARVLCGYGGDGGTRGKLCNPPGLTSTCIPGCALDPLSTSAWCTPSGNPRDMWCDGHPWRPTDMGELMARDRYNTNYNEVILDGAYWNEQLPQSVEAIITSPDDPQATKIHADFLNTYGLSAEDVPLVVFRKDELDAPFVCEVCGSATGSIRGATKAPGGKSTGASGDVESLGYG